MSKARDRLMLRFTGMFLVGGWLVSVGLALAAEPLVTNVRAAQKPGTKLVDVWYDVSGVSTAVYVGLQISSNAGTAFTVPSTALSGGVGANVAAGRNKHIVWNAGSDWNNQLSNTMRFRVTASSTLPAPEGFALIPAGSFEMGNALSASGDGESDELPVHTVQVSVFYMGKYLVTKELWDEVRAWGLSHNYMDVAVGNGSYASKGANHPVHSITWWDMVKWCNARSEKENLTPCYTVAGAVYRTTNNDAVVCDWSANGYRLPSEAEWEKAARGGLIGKRFPWGDTITHSQANYYSSGSYSYDVSPTRGDHPTYAVNGYPYTSPVGSFAANGYGLYDMAGNVWEWCWDFWGGLYYSTSPGTDPRGPATGPYGRVLRGGCPGFSANYSRCAYRFHFGPSRASSGHGFRLARSSVP
jgi:formylglycine-generating enzyme required for sulfatase activity